MASAYQDPSASRKIPVRVYVPILRRTEPLLVFEQQRIAESREMFASRLNKKYKTFLLSNQNYTFFKANSEKGFNGMYLDEEKTWKSYLEGLKISFEFRLIERVKCTNHLTKLQLIEANDKSYKEKLIKAVEQSSRKKVVKLLKKGTDPNFITKEGNTPLGIACEKRGTKGIIFELIKNGANVYFRGKDGLTPLHRAAICSNHEAILTLVQAGASPICRDTKGLTPLHYSVITTEPFPCWYLLNCTPYSFEVDAAISSDSETALHVAAKRGHFLQVEMLMGNGAEVNAVTHTGHTPLHFAVIAGNREIAKMLLENGAHTDCQTAAGNTAKHLAMQLREVEIFNLIGEFDRREPTLPL